MPTTLEADITIMDNNNNNQQQPPPQQQSGLMGAHAQYIKGAAEVLIDSNTPKMQCISSANLLTPV